MKYILLFLIFFYNILNAQPYLNVFSIQGNFTQPHEAGDVNKRNLNTSWFSLQSSFPVIFKNKSAIVFSPSYETWMLDPHGPNTSLKSIYISVTYIKPLSERWRISFSAIPKINYEKTRKVAINNMQLGGAIIATRKISDKLIIKGGMYYNREFFGNYFLPLLGGEWKVNERLNIFGLLPNNLFADYKFSPLIHGGFIYKGITSSYRLLPDKYSDYLRIEEGQLKIFTDLYIDKNIVFSIMCGHTAARNYRKGLINEKGEKIKFHEGWLFEASLNYRLWL